MSSAALPCDVPPIEWALALFRPSDVEHLARHLELGPTGAGALAACQAEAGAAVHRTFGPPRWRRLYFGHEFCERRVPSVHDVRRAYEAAAAEGLAFSLLTGYVTDRGLARLRPVLAWLSGLGDPRVEIVINDWGVARTVRRDHARLQPVLGRLMNRMLRDPRIMPAIARSRAPDDAKAAMCRSSLTAPVFRALLKRMGVGRVEFDNLIQGLDMDVRRLGLAGSLYLPYGYIVTGRICPIGSLNRPPSGSFHVEAGCHVECQLYTLRLQAPPSPYSEGARDYLERGNTCCYYQDPAAIAAAGQVVKQAGIGRIVYQSDLPV